MHHGGETDRLNCQSKTRMTINRNMEVLLGTISIDRILSFNPTISHYWREHAPRRRNLPPELSIKDTYNDYKQKYGSVAGYNKY